MDFPVFWTVLSIALALGYGAVMEAYRYGWKRLPAADLPTDFRPRTTVAVVIPARNEAARLEACLRSVLAGSYPPALLECIVVDDHSEDGTPALVETCRDRWPNLRLLRLAGERGPDGTPLTGKKNALAAGIARSGAELIATTDADCSVPPDWLRRIVAAYEARGWKALTAPVLLETRPTLLERFQALDLLGLMGITGAGLVLGWQRLGNGANLAYPRGVFHEAGGFTGDAHASGDDLFLLQRIARRYPGQIGFVKNPAAAVLTPAQPTWKNFFRQRLRWGSKNAALPETPVRLVLALVFLFCWSILINAGLCWRSPPLAAVLLLQLGVKACWDYRFLRLLAGFFHQRPLLRWFWPCFFLHIAYIAVLGAASLFVRRYRWKGRVVR